MNATLDKIQRSQAAIAAPLNPLPSLQPAFGPKMNRTPLYLRSNRHSSISSSPKLLDQVRNAVRVRHYSIRTEHTYRVKGFAPRGQFQGE